MTGHCNAKCCPCCCCSYNGLDWGASFPTCRGTKQSPVLLPAAGARAATTPVVDAKTKFSYGAITNAKVVNNGHALQVTLPAGYSSNVQVPIKGDATRATATSIINGKGPVSYVKATPTQVQASQPARRRGRAAAGRAMLACLLTQPLPPLQPTRV